MADIKKITTKNFKPRSAKGALPVKATQFNEAVDEIEARLDDIEDGTTSVAAHITDTTDTTSGVTGALIVDGGIGIAKALFVNSATDSTTKDTGAIITQGGIGVEKAIVAGTSVTATTQLQVSATSNQIRLEI